MFEYNVGFTKFLNYIRLSQVRISGNLPSNGIVADVATDRLNRAPLETSKRLFWFAVGLGRFEKDHRVIVECSRITSIAYLALRISSFCIVMQHN